MANLIQCDGCGAISPDHKKQHIANHWTRMKTSHGIKDSGVGRIERHWHNRVFCESCIEKIEQAISGLERDE